jgi:hypothetical protein
MSGGSMDYFYAKLEGVIPDIRGNTLRRRALRAHLLKLVEVLRAVEWNDSGDGDDHEDVLIDNLLRQDDRLEVARTHLRDIIEEAKEFLA